MAWFGSDNAESTRQKFLSNLVDLIKILLEKKMADLAKLVDELSALTVMEAADLSKMLEENGAFPLLLP